MQKKGPLANNVLRSLGGRRTPAARGRGRRLRDLLDEPGPARGGQLGAPPRAAARGEQERAGRGPRRATQSDRSRVVAERSSGESYPSWNRPPDRTAQLRRCFDDILKTCKNFHELRTSTNSRRKIDM